MGARLGWVAAYLIFAAAVLYIGYQLALEAKIHSFSSADRTLTWAIIIALVPGALLLVAWMDRNAS